jgi:hypothetical protein
LLKGLLTALTNAKQGTTLALDKQTIGSTDGAALLQLFSDQLQISSFTLANVALPTSVAGDTLVVSGENAGVTLTLTFQDLRGEVGAEALFQAAATATLAQAFPKLASDFFAKIKVAGASASVSVPGVAALSFTSPRYGVIGLAIPSSGLVTTAIAPRVDGQVAPPSGAKGLFVEIETATSGYRIAPLSGAWAFPDFAWLITGVDILGAFPPIIPTTRLGLNTFDLNLYSQAPGLSSLSLDVADATDPKKPLWSAADGKVALTDVVVTIGLTYAKGAVALAGRGSVQGNFTLGSLVLQAQIPFPLTGVWSLTAYPNLSLSVLDDIAALLPGGAGQLGGLLPAGLAALGSFTFTYLRIAVDAGSFKLVEFTFAVGSTATWTLIPGVVAIDSLDIQMTIDGTPSVTGSAVGNVVLPKGSDLTVRFGRNDASQPWRLDAVSAAIALPSLANLAQLAQGTDLAAMVQAGGLGGLAFVMTNVNFGLTISPTALTNFGLTLQLADADKDPLEPIHDWPLIKDVLTLTEFAFGFQLIWGEKSSKTVFGKFALNGLEFAVTFAQQKTQGGNADALVAEYSAQGAAGRVHIKDLIHAISPSVAQDLPDLEINLADALLVYLNKKYLFAMDVSVEMPLSDLPLIGKALPADAKVGLKNLKVVVASAAMSADDVTFINGLLPQPVLPLPGANAAGDAIPAGFSMVAELELGALSVLMTSPPAKRSPTAAVVLTAAPPRPLAAAPATDPVMWIDIQKTFGPVSIQKVGFSYRSGSLFVVSNLALAAGGLEIDLIGIGLGSPISHPALQFTIQGLAVSFSEGPVSVMGGMIGSLEPHVDFVGALSVRAPELSLAAFAGYAEYEDHPSLFLYAVLDTPIGGPPAFFVTGVAAGLGFNRKLAVPDVAGVATFPLVAWAQGNGAPAMDPTKPMGDQVTTALGLLAQSGVVAPSVGDYWFAAGLRFTSFEIVDSFALLTLSIGADVEIALLGLSTLTVPPQSTSPVAEVQLALEVAFSYDKGLISIAGQLTDNSYVLSRACRLTGGFAFYLWFAGDHHGETILTLGGYNPNFDVPKYYPSVPRLGLNWQLVPELSITGSLYFALNPNVVMAGGKLSAVWNSGPISAWFTYWADFLMTFSPFHYYVDGGIDLGASFTIDLWLFSISITIHIGIGIALWGPPFAGRATVDLSIISFTITFGPQGEDDDKFIHWDQFVQQLLPAQPSNGKQRRGRPLTPLADAPPPAAVVQINVTAGLLRKLPPTAAGPVYLVNAETVQCAVLTVIPNKQVTLAPDPDPNRPKYDNLDWAPDCQQPKRDGKPIVANTAFCAGPANVSEQDFQPALALTVSSPEDSVFHAVRRFSNAPKALWDKKSFTSHNVPQADRSTALKQTTIPDALVGVTLIPYLDRPDTLTPIPLESLLFELDAVQPFDWSPGSPPTADAFSGQTVAGTIATPTVAAVRGALIGALAGQGVPVKGAVDVSRLRDPANADIEAAPRLLLLGEQAAA